VNGLRTASICLPLTWQLRPFLSCCSLPVTDNIDDNDVLGSRGEGERQRKPQRVEADLTREERIAHLQAQQAVLADQIYALEQENGNRRTTAKKGERERSKVIRHADETNPH
jgi:hypothetical protein